MIDFLKFYITDNSTIQHLENHYLLEWVKSEDKLNLFDIEVIKTKTVKHFKGIVFCFFSNRVDIIFKPHYYFNDGLHNANDFKVIDCIQTILELKTLFKIDLDLLKIVNIEFGLNIVSPIDIKNLIAFLLYHERNEFKTDLGLAYSKKSFKANANGTMNTYKIIKAYAKGLQFPEHCNINTFRFEIKSKQSKYFNQFGIYTANDLLKYDCYVKISNEIINEFDKVLLLDCETDFSCLKASEQTKITKYLNTLTWFNISQDPYKNRFNKERAKYLSIVSKVENNLKNRIENLIFKKLELLKSGYISTQNESKIKSFQNIKSGYYSTIYKGGNVTQTEKATDKKERRICRVTKLDISMQKDESILLSHSGIKYYLENNPNTFEKIKTEYLSSIWLNSDLKTQIKEIAHNIRNTHSNQLNKQNKLYPKNQIQLFA